MKKPTERARLAVDQFPALRFAWSTSRARETYGYNICTLYLVRPNGHEVRAARCNGGGYDMQGTALGSWMQDFFRDDLKKLSSDIGSNTPWNTRGAFYGLSFWDGKRGKYRKTWKPGYTVYLDGGCGFSSMEHILNALGLSLHCIARNGKNTLYTLNIKER